MYRTLTIATFLIALFALQPVRAHADTLPDERLVTDVRVLAAYGVASEFWTSRNVPSPCTDVRLRTADLDYVNTGMFAVATGDWHAVAGGLEWRSDCRVVFDRAALGFRLAAAQDRRLPLKDRRWLYAEVCAVLTHELGHIRGLAVPTWDGHAVHGGHSSTGLMAAYLTRAAVPWECRLLARELLPREVRRRSSRRNYRKYK